MKSYRALLAALLVVQVEVLGAGKNYPRVSTKQGYVRGIQQRLRCEEGHIKTIYKFLGIPFAQAPNGTLRFKRPEPLTMKRSSEYNATYYRPICAQKPNSEMIRGAWPDFDPKRDVSEDCLFLNIYTPFINGRKKYPVMVFIHEGHFYGGTPIFGDAPGEYLPTRDVVLVTIQYRLGSFGFFTTGDSEAPGNMGLLDQVEALKWVQQNIEGFGGDKNSVTLFGESAGGTSVALHYLSSKSEGLFHRGIAVSGVDLQVGPLILKPQLMVEGASNKLMKDLKCDNIQCLRSSDWNKIVDNTKINIMSPVVDNYFLQGKPRKLRQDGNFQKLPLMAGFTSQEGSQFVQLVLSSLPRVSSLQDRQSFQTVLMVSLKKRLFVQNEADQYKYAQAIMREYLPHQSYKGAMVEVFTDLTMVAPIHAALTFHSNHNAPTFMFEFAHAPKRVKSNEWMGATHGDTKVYEFGKPLLKPQGYDYADRNVSDIMVTMFTNFAKFGNPTPSPVHGVQWQKFDSANKAYLKIKKNPVMDSKYHEKKIEFWNKFTRLFNEK